MIKTGQNTFVGKPNIEWKNQETVVLIQLFRNK